MEDGGTWVELSDALRSNAAETILSILNGNDVEVDHRDVTHDLQTLLMRLCYTSFGIDPMQRILGSLFDLDPDVNIQDSWGRTALMHACIANQPIIIEGMLQYENTNVGLVDFEGNSCLMYALQHCDIYTLEDILEHKSGPPLLTTHNSKGQSPYSIAKDSSDQSVYALFQSYLDKSVSLQKKNKKRLRRRQNSDVVSLPPTYSPSTERKAAYSQPRTVLQLTKGGAVKTIIQNSHETNGEKNIETIKLPRRENLSLDINIAADLSRLTINRGRVSGNSESAPVTHRDVRFNDEKEGPGPALALTSARLSRHHHKRDNLIRESMKLKPHTVLPFSHSQSSTDSLHETLDGSPEAYMRRQRRPSISLPDLRDKFLVNYGQNSPTSGSCDTPPGSETDDQYQIFAESYPNETLSGKKKSKRGRDKLLLPEIHGSLTNLCSPGAIRNNKVRGPRGRKLSNSDDQLQRVF